jgi:hypothetical protein
MSDRQDLDPDPRSKCPGNVEQNDPGRGRLQLTRSGILRIHNGMHPDPNFTGLQEVSDARVRDLLRLGVTCQYGGERDHEKQPFHARLQGIPMCAASKRGARNPGARRLRLKLPHFDTLNAV